MVANEIQQHKMLLLQKAYDLQNQKVLSQSYRHKRNIHDVLNFRTLYPIEWIRWKKTHLYSFYCLIRSLNYLLLYFRQILCINIDKNIRFQYLNMPYSTWTFSFLYLSHSLCTSIHLHFLRTNLHFDRHSRLYSCYSKPGGNIFLIFLRKASMGVKITIVQFRQPSHQQSSRSSYAFATL